MASCLRPCPGTEAPWPHGAPASQDRASARTDLLPGAGPDLLGVILLASRVQDSTCGCIFQTLAWFPLSSVTGETF